MCVTCVRKYYTKINIGQNRISVQSPHRGPNTLLLGLSHAHKTEQPISGWAAARPVQLLLGN